MDVDISSIHRINVAISKKVAAVAPIDGVGIGDFYDRSTWKIHFKEEATPEQRAEARRVLEEYNTGDLTADDFAGVIQSHVDGVARSKGYADGVALAGYSSSTIPAWANEAQAFIAWRDAVWVYAYTELAKVQGGQREVPTVAGLLAELPPIIWP